MKDLHLTTVMRLALTISNKFACLYLEAKGLSS